MKPIDKIHEMYEGAIVLSGLDDAIVGVTYDQHGYHVVYDYEKMLAIFMQDMSEEDAVEYIDYNVFGLRFDENYPTFLLSKW